MRGQAVAPQQYVGFARYERKTGVGEDAADGRETTAEAIERRKIIGIVGFQLRRGAVGIRRRLARDNSDRTAGQQNHRCEAGGSKRGAVCLPQRFQAERLLDEPPGQI